MTDLLSRLQSASEGSAELDRDVLIACGWTDRGASRIAFRWIDPSGVLHALDVMPTRSLDDITGLIEQAGMRWYRFRITTGARMVVESAEQECWSDHEDACLALCISFRRAMEAGR